MAIGLIALGGYAGATGLAAGALALGAGAVGYSLAFYGGALLGALAVKSFVDLITPGAESEIKGILTTRKGAVQPLEVIYGRRQKAGGEIFLARSDKEVAAVSPIYETRLVSYDSGDSLREESVAITSGSAAYTLPNAYRWVVYQIADGDVPIEGIESIYIDDELLVGSKYEDYVDYQFTDGSHTSQPFTDLEAATTTPAWTSQHLVLGTVAIAIRMEWNKDIFDGVPEFTFVVKGTKLLDLDSLPQAPAASSVSSVPEVISYVGSSASWTAFTVDEKAYYTDTGGSNYTTPQLWDDAYGNTSGDLVTDNEIAAAELNAEDFIGYIHFRSGWTTDATRYPIVRARVGSEYNHVTDTGAKIWRNSPLGIYSEARYLRLERIRIGSYSWDDPIRVSGTYDNTFDCRSCTLLSSYSVSQYNGTGNYLRACLILVPALVGTNLLRYFNVINCTIICRTDTNTIRGSTVYNTVVYNSDTSPYYGNFPDVTGGDNAQATTDTYTPTNAAVISIDDLPSTAFKDYAGENYSLSGATSELYHAGSPTYAPELDNNGVPFDSVNPSIGAFEFVISQSEALALIRRYSNNPAEAQFDYLINPIYGKGLSPIDGVDLKVASFISARDYANNSVTSYSGGPAHARMSSNAVLTAGSTVMDNMRQLLVGCRGTLPYINGLFNLMIERDYAFTEYKDGEGGDYSEFFDFNEDNIIGSWKIKAGDIGTRYNQVKVIFPNEEKKFESDFVTVYSNEFRAEDGRLLEKTFTLTGVTNAYQATDTANVIMRKSRQQIDVSFMATPRARNVTAGEIVTITHATPSWSLKKFRVSSIVLLATGNCGVTVAEHEPTVYDLTVPNEIETSPDTNFPDPTIVGSLAIPTLLSDETLVKKSKDGTLTPQLRITWVAPSDPFVVGYDVQIKDISSTELVWQTVASPNSIDSVTVTIAGVEDGVAYDVRVRARNSGGWVGAWATSENHIIGGQPVLPSNVPNFYISGNVLSWGSITDFDRAGYIIRFQPGVNRSWGDANPVHDGIITESPHSLSIEIFGQNTIMIKAINRTGRLSATPTSLLANLDNPVISNTFEVVDDHALGFTGTVEGGAVDSGDLKADSQTPLIWGDALSNMYTSNSADMWITTQYSQMTYLRTVGPSFSAAGKSMVIESTISGGHSQITYRPESPDLMWESLDTEPMWEDDDSNSSYADPPPYVQWPGRLKVTAQPYNFKFDIAQGVTRGVISELAFKIDAIDITETLADVVISSGGTRLSLTKTYSVIKSVTLTLQDDGGTAATVKVMDKNVTSGPLIQGLDSSDSATGCNVDATIIGY
jgi:hypothetical protein